MKKNIAPISLDFPVSLRRPGMADVLLAGLIITLAPLARAGTIGISEGKLIVGTEAGDGNQAISASIAGTDLLISGVNFDIVTPGCSGVGTVTCALSGFSELILLGGSGDDAISLGAITTPPPFTTLILGGAGNDVLVGSAGDDTIFGGLGDDVLIGGPGVDCLLAGPGNNVVIQLRSCVDGPDPVIKPLPRAGGDAPEPGGLFLLGTGLVAIPVVTRTVRRRRAKQQTT